jgi:hypothetical protein
VLNNPLSLTDPTGLQAGNHTGDVYTNGRSYGKSPFVGQNSWQVQGLQANFVDATDGYTYSVSRSGWAELGRTADLNARAERAMGGDRLHTFFAGFEQGYYDSFSGVAKGAGNTAIGSWNLATGLAINREAAFTSPNPLGIEPYPIYSATEARNSFGTQLAFIFAPMAAGAPFAAASSLSVVPETQVFRFSANLSESNVSS